MKRLLAAALLLLPLLAAAQGSPSFSAQVDRTRLTVGESLILNLTLEGNVSGVDSLPYPQVDDHFTLVRAEGPSTEQSISIVNGSMTRYLRLTTQLVYQARRAGTVTIPSVAINPSLRTLPIQVDILEPAPLVVSDGGTGWMPPTDPYFEVKVDKSEAYVGEQIVATWSLFLQNERIRLFDRRLPTAGDFLTEDLGDPNTYDLVPREFGGEVWKQVFIKSTAFYPIKDGEVVLDPLILRLLTEGGPINLESQAVKVTVKPLPEEGKPAGFAGAVGEFTLSLDPAQLTMETDTPFKFILTVRGTGYPDFIGKPEIKLTSDFDLYTEKVEKSVERQGGRAVAVVKYRMIIVPHKPGDFELGPFSMPYFDPQAAAYLQAQSPLIRLSVTQGRNLPPRLDEPAQTIAPLGQDLRYIKTDRSELADDANLAANPIFVGGQLVPALAVAGALLFRRRRERLASDPALARRLRAGKKSRDLLRAAGAAARAGDSAAACDQAGRALASYISDRFGLPEQGLTTGDAVSALPAAGVTAETAAEVESILSECDLARYAPGAVAADRAASLPQRVEAVMKRLAREAK